MTYENYTMNTLGCIGLIILFPVMNNMLKMMDNMNTYIIKETSDTYLLCDRVGDLESEVKSLREEKDKLLTMINDIKKEVDEVQKEVKHNWMPTF